MKKSFYSIYHELSRNPLIASGNNILYANDKNYNGDDSLWLIDKQLKDTYGDTLYKRNGQIVRIRE
jgi:hypothetical protein